LRPPPSNAQGYRPARSFQPVQNREGAMLFDAIFGRGPCGI
jgi:hypothetical protein